LTHSVVTLVTKQDAIILVLVLVTVTRISLVSTNCHIFGIMIMFLHISGTNPRFTMESSFQEIMASAEVWGFAPRGLRSTAPGQGVKGRSLLKLKTFSPRTTKREENLTPIIADS